MVLGSWYIMSGLVWSQTEVQLAEAGDRQSQSSYLPVRDLSLLCISTVPAVALSSGVYLTNACITVCM